MSRADAHHGVILDRAGSRLACDGHVERKVARLGVAASLTKPLDFGTLLEHVARCRLGN